MFFLWYVQENLVFCQGRFQMLVAISVCYWSMIKIYYGMVYFLRFLWENRFLCLFGYIWVERHFPLISPLANFNEILVHNLCRRDYKWSKKVMYHLQIIFLKILSYERSFIYTKKSKGPSIEPCGTPARTGDQFEDWQLRTTLWNLSLRKLWKSVGKLPEIPTVSSLYSNPSCQTLSKAFEISKKLALTSSEGLWSKSA